jgi:colanic acid biosynthesis protein WcaH
MALLSEENFANLVRMAPLVAVDLILRDPDGHVLVARRNNNPAKGYYFVPGGSIRKDEKIHTAFARILGTETGLDVPFAAVRLLGAYDHVYTENRFGQPGFGTHYVVLGYEVTFAQRPNIRLDAQHSDYVWMPAADLLASKDVHENTKAYLFP